ncbi:MAG: hypothetical protein ACKOC5_14155 [Chloroflexota bacterium]
MIVIRRIFGLLLIIATAIGLIFSIFVTVAIWRAQETVSTGIQSTVSLLGDTLQTTATGLVVTKDALKSSVQMIADMQTTLETTAKTIDSTNPMIDEIVNLMDKQLPDTIIATQNSLVSAQESARVIDQVLGTLSGIPLIGSGIGYNPEVPLGDALGDVAQSLDGLPESFKGMQTSLRNTQNNVQTFQADLTVVAGSVGQIEASVAQYEQVVSNYQASLDQVQQRLDTLEANVPGYVRTGTIGLTVFLVWMMLAQIGLFTQGWEMFTLENI